MTLHRFSLVNGLLLSTMMVASAQAQSSYDQPTLADRMSVLRSSWSQQSIDPAVQRASHESAPEPGLLAQASGNQGFSIIPNWLSRRSEKSSGQQNGNQAQRNGHPQWNVTQQANRAGQPSGNSGSTTNGSSRSNADAMPPEPVATDDVTLPGMGGSPLPRAGGQAAGTGSIANNNALKAKPQANVATGNTQQRNPSNQAGPRTATRPLNVGTPGAAANNTSTATTRNSPTRRTAPHINPDDLRRELSGSFSSPAIGNKTAPEVARTNEQTQPQNNTVTSNESVASGTPSTMSTNDAKQSPTASTQTSENLQFNRPTTDSAAQNAPEAVEAQPKSPAGFGASSFLRAPFASPAPAGPQTVRGKEAFGEALQVAGGGDPNVLASNQTPILTADIRGPKQILVGRESVYRIHLQNQSDIPAEGIIATIRMPSGADVMNTTASQGTVQQSQDGQSKGHLQWQVARLERRAGETLEIRLVPRESRPLELGISWTVAPVGSRAVVEVQEPKLQLDIAGPNEVMYDRPQVFKMTISNPGTGPAENVRIELVPPGGGQDAASTHPLGDLAPGASQTIEVELTAREAGKMFVKAVASGEGGLACDASKEIFCRKPELEVDWRGPATKYSGTMATYYFRVRNPGTAPADDIVLKATLPDGAEYTSGSEGQMYDTKQRVVSWRVGTLGPGEDNYMELKCIVKTAGTNRVNVTAATEDGGLTASKTVETNVIAIADLKLDVTDPSGPVAVGSQAVYEIRIQNRGANAAKDVNVVALFSEGIEPEQAEGAMYTVADGRVSFKTIQDLPAGRDVVLRIRAHAVQAGTHIFRAEVLCRDLEIKLAAEETTRFYADDTASEGGDRDKQANSRSEAFDTNVR